MERVQPEGMPASSCRLRRFSVCSALTPHGRICVATGSEHHIGLEEEGTTIHDVLASFVHAHDPGLAAARSEMMHWHYRRRMLEFELALTCTLGTGK